MLLDFVGCSLLIQTNKVEQVTTDMEWQTGPDVRNNQCTTSKNESNDKRVAGVADHETDPSTI